MRRLDGVNRLLWRDDGAVTIFAVVVLSSLLLFFAVLIDYARIAALHKLAEDTARSGVRSVLSAYDTWLYERYGLFGRGGTDGKEIFRQVLEGNLEKSSSSTFTIMEARVEGAEVHTLLTLGEHEVFARSVLEEMKYKAPIDFTLEIAARLAPLAGAMKEASHAVDTLTQLRHLYEKREGHIEAVFKFQQQAADELRGSAVHSLIPIGVGGGFAGTAAAAVQGYSAYAEMKLYDLSLPEDGEPLYKSETAKYEQEVWSLNDAIRRAGDSLHFRHMEFIGKAEEELEKAGALNEEMRRTAERANRDANAAYDAISGSKVPGSTGSGMLGSEEAELAEVRKAGKELVLGAEWFANYKQELLQQGADGTGYIHAGSQWMSNLQTAMSNPGAQHVHSATLSNSLTAIHTAYRLYHERYVVPGSVLRNRQQILAGGELKKKLKEQESKAEARWRQARNLLNGIASMPSNDEHTRQFREVEKRYRESLLFNTQSDDGSSQLQQPAGEAYEAARQSSATMDNMFAGLSDMLRHTRDNFYFGEYVVARYSRFEPQHLFGLMSNGDISGLAGLSSFHNQEAEYVLYGFHTPTGNLIAAYGELFSVRLAIRTMEGLIASRSLGHPLLILSAAIVYGLEGATADMLSLAERGAAPLSKYAKIDLGYKDYLRMFMLLHGGQREERLARMIAVIEQNGNLKLSSVPAGVTGEARLSIKLLFLPGVMKLLGKWGMLDGKVAGNRYESRKIVGWSY
ncbi:TadE/TadG family type IV pilus assembly protein [Paenibacillus chungangensis]|uniref:Flp pilus-assembly TadG-like N-terminal domain-containing protein n=1 Tax=Paenibacillus chungangensis TaxID=696535 RepID=A0ABW3HUF8_9BACL